ncbi:MAG: hypothetical protein MMC33_007229 [Icmadophila ericetorum]|nr:hypothetical protein [Icmadophila ericetorum]
MDKGYHKDSKKSIRTGMSSGSVGGRGSSRGYTPGTTGDYGAYSYQGYSQTSVNQGYPQSSNSYAPSNVAVKGGPTQQNNHSNYDSAPYSYSEGSQQQPASKQMSLTQDNLQHIPVQHSLDAYGRQPRHHEPYQPGVQPAGSHQGQDVYGGIAGLERRQGESVEDYLRRFEYGTR